MTTSNVEVSLKEIYTIVLETRDNVRDMQHNINKALDTTTEHAKRIERIEGEVNHIKLKIAGSSALGSIVGALGAIWLGKP